MTILRRRLLAGHSIALAPGTRERVVLALRARHARVEILPGPLDMAANAERVGEWASERGPFDAVVYDAAEPFGAGGIRGLEAAIEEAWIAVREVAVGALIPSDAPGKVVLLGPPAAGELAQAALAALENLVRTLSVEWARYGLTSVMIAPGPSTSDDELAELVCYLVSPAAAYLSGCRVALGAVTR